MVLLTANTKFDSVFDSVSRVAIGDIPNFEIECWQKGPAFRAF